MDMQQAQKIAKAFKCTLSMDAQGIINKINDRNGECPCRIDGTKCPCPHLKGDLEEHGACHCNLFVGA